MTWTQTVTIHIAQNPRDETPPWSTPLSKVWTVCVLHRAATQRRARVEMCVWHSTLPCLLTSAEAHVVPAFSTTTVQRSPEHYLAEEIASSITAMLSREIRIARTSEFTLSWKKVCFLYVYAVLKMEFVKPVHLMYGHFLNSMYIFLK